MTHRELALRLTLALALACAGCAQAPSPEPAAVTPRSVAPPAPIASAASRQVLFAAPVHFASPDGSEVVVEAGLYQVAPAAGGLRVAKLGADDGVVIAADESAASISVDVETAMLIGGQDGDAQQLVLVTPDGRALHAEGAVNGMRSRRAAMRTLTTTKLRTTQTATLSGSIQVSSPRPKESWTAGASKSITWARYGRLHSSVSIFLMQGPRVVATIVTGAPNSGAFQWAIPSWQGAGIYQVLVATVDNTVKGYGPSFTIQAPPQPTTKTAVLSPTATRKLLAQQSRTLEPATTTLPTGITSAGPTQMPYVSNLTGMSTIGAEIVFHGSQLEPGWFQAKVGPAPIAIDARHSTDVAIVGRLPGTPVVGDLTVGYGTPETTWTFQAGYRVRGEPRITSASPTSFTVADTVTLTGTDLDAFNVWNITHLPSEPDNALPQLLKISSSPASIGNDFVAISHWTVTPDGTQASFKVGRPMTALEFYTSSLSNVPPEDLGYAGSSEPTSPQPAQLSGVLRLATTLPFGWGNDRMAYDLVGPSVVWSQPSFQLTNISPPEFPTGPDNEPGDFIFTLAQQSSRYVLFSGYGLSGADFQLGTMPLSPVFYDDQGGYIVLPDNAQSGDVRAIRDGVVAPSPQPLHVAHGPVLLQPPPARWGLPLGQEIVLQGFFLKTSTIPGATYSFDPGLYENANCPVEVQVLEYTENVIRFRLTAGTLAASCSQPLKPFGTPNHMTQQYMKIVATKNGQQKTLWSNEVYVELP